jgi:hypothetical protein
MPMGGLALTRQDWVEVCRVLHAAEVYDPAGFIASGQLYPAGGLTSVRLCRVSEQAWDRWRKYTLRRLRREGRRWR